jgi:hypothetical protein
MADTEKIAINLGTVNITIKISVVRVYNIPAGVPVALAAALQSQEK